MTDDLLYLLGLVLWVLGVLVGGTIFMLVFVWTMLAALATVEWSVRSLYCRARKRPGPTWRQCLMSYDASNYY